MEERARGGTVQHFHGVWRPGIVLVVAELDGFGVDEEDCRLSVGNGDRSS